MEWRAIANHEDFEVSENGDVRKIRNNIRARGRSLAQRHGSKGYLMVTLWENGKGKCFTISNLICRGFHGSPPTPDHEAAHNDGDHFHNHYSNLRWATRKENMEDREKHGNTMRGSTHWSTDLTEEDVLTIRKTHSEMKNGNKIPNGGLKILANQYGITEATLVGVIYRKAWKHI